MTASLTPQADATPHGIICPLATPLTAAERLDVGALSKHVSALAPDIDGLFVLGSSGEHPWLSASVEDELIECCAALPLQDLPLFIGIGEASTSRTLSRLESLRDSPATYFVVTPPTYFPVVDDNALITYYRTIAAESDRPIVLYNVPQNTGNLISLKAVEELSTTPGIAGIKDSSGDFITFQAMLTCQSDTFAVLQGREQLMAASLLMGARGMVSSMTNFAARLLRTLLEAVTSGSSEEIIRRQRQVSEFARVFDEGYWVCALKATLDLCGFSVGVPSLPLPPVTDTQKRRIAEILANVPPELRIAAARASDN